MSFKKSSILFFFLTVAAFLLRILTLSKLMVFTPDEEYLLYIAQTLVRNFHVIWIGVSALGFDFYMGPGFIYILYPFVAVFRGDPLFWGVMASLSGIITGILIYWFGKKLFGVKAGFIAAILYLFSALIIYYDQQPYPTGVPLLSVLILISIYMTKYSKWWWVIFSFFYGWIFHIHLSLFLMIFVALYWALIHKNTLNKKIIISSIITFILVISPLIAFDYFHKGSNIAAPIRIIQAIGKSKTKFNLSDRLITLGKSVSRLAYLDMGKSNTDEILYPCNSVIGNNATKIKWSIVVLVIILSVIFISKKDLWKDERKRLLLLSCFPFLVPFIFLPSIGSVEYYLLGFFPILFLIIGLVVSEFSGFLKFVSYVVIILFIFYNVIVVLNASGDYGIKVKKDIIHEVMGAIGNNPYRLSEAGGACQGSAGWRYLFLVYGNKPVQSDEDKNFSWLWPDEVSNKKARYEVLMRERRAFTSDPDVYKYKFSEGGFDAFIFEK